MTDVNQHTARTASAMINGLKLYQEYDLWYWEFGEYSSEYLGIGGMLSATGALCHFTNFVLQNSSLA